MSEMDTKTLFSGEVTYVRPNYSASGGATVTLRLNGLSELQIFDGHEGKRYMLALVEIGNDEQPTSTPPYKKGCTGPLCEWAVMRCKEAQFWEFLNEEFPEVELVDSEDSAKEALLNLCSVQSRKEIDQYQEASLYFKDAIMSPYRNWLQREEVRA